MAPSAVVLIADGSEEMEFVTPYDVLVRAGFDVKSVGVDLKNGSYAVCSRGVKIIPDISSVGQIVSREKTTMATPDVLVLPGGAPGAATFCKSQDTLKLIQACKHDNKHIAFICAATTALVEAAKQAPAPWKSRVTSHPSAKDRIVQAGWDYAPDNETVVVDGRTITSRGPGTALLFALTIVEKLAGKEKRAEVAKPMITAETGW